MAKIINFHDIYDRQWFYDTMKVIQSMYEVVPFSEIEKFYRGESISKNIVHLTVDDGHISTYTIIYPILKELGITASIFVSPKIIEDRTNFWYYECGDYDRGKLRESIAEVLNVPLEKIQKFYPRSIMKTLSLKTNWEIIHHYQKKNGVETKTGQYINKEQLVELEHSGVFCIGAHTMNHPILANETAEISEYEIKESVKKLSDLLGRKVTTFAYPNGSPGLDFGQRELNYLKEIEVKYAFSFEYRNLRKNDDLLSIPRYGLDHGNEEFIRKKLKYGAFWEPFKKRFLNNEDKHRMFICKEMKNLGVSVDI